MLQAASAPDVTATAGLAAQGAVVIVDDETGVGEALADALAQRGEPALLTTADDPADQEAMTELVERLRAGHGGAKAVVHLAALAEGWTDEAGLRSLLAARPGAGPGPRGRRRGRRRGRARRHPARRHLRRRRPSRRTRPPRAPSPASSSRSRTSGPTVRVKGVDLSAAPPEAAAQRLLDELYAADDAVEIGYRDGERTALALAPAPLDGRPEEAPLDGDSVLLVTGGARGITAAGGGQLGRALPADARAGRAHARGGGGGAGDRGATDPRELRPH